jgi:hypothetical protein
VLSMQLFTAPRFAAAVLCSAPAKPGFFHIEQLPVRCHRLCRQRVVRTALEQDVCFCAWS